MERPNLSAGGGVRVPGTGGSDERLQRHPQGPGREPGRPARRLRRLRAPPPDRPPQGGRGLPAAQRLLHPRGRPRRPRAGRAAVHHQARGQRHQVPRRALRADPLRLRGPRLLPPADRVPGRPAPALRHNAPAAPRGPAGGGLRMGVRRPPGSCSTWPTTGCASASQWARRSSRPGWTASSPSRRGSGRPRWGGCGSARAASSSAPASRPSPAGAWSSPFS